MRNGAVVRKDHTRLAVCGDLDELNCFLGAALAVLDARGARVRSALEAAQQALLVGASVVASPKPVSRTETARLAAAVRAVDESLKGLSAELAPLRGFVVPGGAPAGAWLHVARAVCRRAERGVVALAARESVPGGLGAFLNRLSAGLFIAARWVNEKPCRSHSRPRNYVVEGGRNTL